MWFYVYVLIIKQQTTQESIIMQSQSDIIKKAESEGVIKTSKTGSNYYCNGFNVTFYILHKLPLPVSLRFFDIVVK